MPPIVSELSSYPPNLAETAASANGDESADGHTRSDLDARQDEVLKLLDELNARIEAVIGEFTPGGADEDSKRARPTPGADDERRTAAA